MLLLALIVLSLNLLITLSEILFFLLVILGVMVLMVVVLLLLLVLPVPRVAAVFCIVVVRLMEFQLEADRSDLWRLLVEEESNY